MDRSSAERSEEVPQWGFPCTKEQFEAALNQTEDYVRKKPAQSLLFAFMTGYYVGHSYYVWRPGHWRWRGGQRVWIHGHYVIR
jgi:WXXGXW repeat (2 copies)